MKTIETHLVKTTSKSPEVCTNCNKTIIPGNAIHLEEGVNEHLHSLLARRFCSKCYAKFGEPALLTGNK